MKKGESVEQLKIEYIPVDELNPYENNARKHGEEDVQAIVRSIEEFGFNDPIGIWHDTIVEGHGRLLAAKELGMDSVPIIRLDHMTDEERRAYGLAHNKTAELSAWDFEKLEEELDELDIDMSEFGFDMFAGSEEPAEIVEDEPPEPPEEPITKVGDIWQLGGHRLVCGDSTDSAVIDRLMDGVKADMVFTDPPWNVNYGAVKKGNAMGYKPRTIKNDFMGTEEFKEFMYSAFRVMNNASKDGCVTYVVMSAQEWGNMMLTLAQNGYHWSSTIIWNKDHLVLSRKDYHTKYEPIWYGWKDGAPRLCPLEDRKQSDVWDFDRPIRSDEHPTMKPVALVARAVMNSSKTGNAVLDLFGGSGTTLIACEQLSRNCYMAELDPKYCDVIVKRWEEFTGKDAKKL